MKTNKLFEYLVIPAVMLLVCMTFFTSIPSTLKLLIRTFFLIVFFILWRYFSRRNPQQKPKAGFVGKNWPWILIFVIANGLIAPMLIHAGADLMIIIPVFASYGVSGL